MAIDKKELDDVLKRAREIALGDHPADALTIKDLKLAADPKANKIITNDQKASIISIVILAT